MIPNPLNLPDEGDLLQAAGFEIMLERRRVANLHLPTGRLVVCDPLISPESEPFAVDFPSGAFPVYVIMAKMRDETRPAYVVIEFDEQRPHRWEIGHLAGEESSWGGDRLGAYVESNVLAFMDEQTASILMHLVHEDDAEFEKTIRRAMRRNRRSGAQVELADMRVDPMTNGNVLAFDADLGTYVTYFGYGPDETVTMAVLDFEVLDYQFTPFGLKY